MCSKLRKARIIQTKARAASTARKTRQWVAFFRADGAATQAEGTIQAVASLEG